MTVVEVDRLRRSGDAHEGTTNTRPAMAYPLSGFAPGVLPLIRLICPL